MEWDNFEALSETWISSWLSFASMMYVFIEWKMVDVDQYLLRVHQEMETIEGPNKRDNRILWTILVCIPLKTPRESFGNDLNPDDLFLSSILFSCLNERQAMIRNSVLFDVAIAALRMRISTMPESQSSPQIFQLLNPIQPYCDHYLNLLRIWYDKMRNQDLTNFSFLDHEMLCSLANCSSLPVSSEIIKSLGGQTKNRLYPIEFLCFLPHRVQRRITQRISMSFRVSALPTESIEYFMRVLYLTDDIKAMFRVLNLSCQPFTELLIFRLMRLLRYDPSPLLNEACAFPLHPLPSQPPSSVSSSSTSSPSSASSPMSQPPSSSSSSSSVASSGQQQQQQQGGGGGKNVGFVEQTKDRMVDLLKIKLVLNMKELSAIHTTHHPPNYRFHYRLLIIGMAKCLKVFGIVDYSQTKGLKKFIDRIKHLTTWNPRSLLFMPPIFRDLLLPHDSSRSSLYSDQITQINHLVQVFHSSSSLPSHARFAFLTVLFFNVHHHNLQFLIDALLQLPFLDLLENISLLVEIIFNTLDKGDCPPVCLFLSSF